MTLKRVIRRLLLRNIFNLLIPLIEQQQGFKVNASRNNFNVLQLKPKLERGVSISQSNKDVDIFPYMVCRALDAQSRRKKIFWGD